MPAAIPIAAGISAGTSLFGGIKGSGAASKAAQIQSDAAQQAARLMQAVPGQVNPAIQNAADQARADALNAAITSGTGLTGAASTAGQNLTDQATAANTLLNPYVTAGQGAITNLADLMAPGGQLTQPFGVEQMQTMDPGYQFRIDQANKALQASAAARGGALGGGVLRSLDTQTQNLASSEMQNAFERWNTQQQNLYSRLSGMAGQGLTAGTQAGANLLNAAQQAGAWNYGAAGQAGNWLTGGTQYGGTAEQNAAQNIAANVINNNRTIADLMTGGAAAKAAGTVGAANAWSGALGGIANAGQGVANYYAQQQLLQTLFGTGTQQKGGFLDFLTSLGFPE